MSRNDQHYRNGSDANRSGNKFQNHQSVGQHRPNSEGHRGVGYQPGHDRALDRAMEIGGWISQPEEGHDAPTAGGHAGRGPKGYCRSDQRIEEEVNEVLTRDGVVDASEIEVKVVAGEVTLSGTVQDLTARRHAEDVAGACCGVRQVSNQLRVDAVEVHQTEE